MPVYLRLYSRLEKSLTCRVPNEKVLARFFTKPNTLRRQQ